MVLLLGTDRNIYQEGTGIHIVNSRGEVGVRSKGDGRVLLTFTKLIRIVHILVSSYTVSKPWFTDCASI